MIISDAVVGELRAPLRMPFKTALREVTELKEVTLRLTDSEGNFGLGSVVPTPAITGDTEAKIISDLNSILAELVKVKLSDLSVWQEGLHCKESYSNSALCAVDVALCDLASRKEGVPLWRWLGGRESLPMTTNMTISVDDPEVMALRAQEAVSNGFRALKIKVGQDAELDKERVRAVRCAVDVGVTLRLDANQGWTESDASELMGWFSKNCSPIDFIEQPVPARELAAMKRLAQSSSVVLLADESAMSYEQATKVIRMGAAHALSVKLTKAGGLLSAKSILDFAHSHEIPCLMSCMFEVGAGLQAAAHLASVHPAVRWVDLDPLEYLLEVPYSGGALFSGAQIQCGNGVGLAIETL